MIGGISFQLGKEPRGAADARDMAQQTDEFTEEQIRAFDRDGFIVVRHVAGEEIRRRMLSAVREGLERRISPLEYEADLSYPGSPASREASGGQTVRRLRAAHSRGMAFTEWVHGAGLVNRLRQLLSGPIVMPLAHHNCVMTKQPRFSSETGWHQDIRYWSFARPELINAWLALGPERRENGCLRVIPGSHALVLERERFDERVFLREDLPENVPLIATAVDAELDPGDVLFFHAKTLHSARRNESDQAKYSAVFTFRPLDNPPVPDSRSASLPELLLG